MRNLRLPFFFASAALIFVMGGCKSAGDGTTDTTTTATKTESGGGTGGGTRPAVTSPGVTSSGDTIKVGLVASLSGDQISWGVDSKNGAQMAVDEVNAAGGIDGKKVELDIQDSQSKPDGAKTAAQKLLSDGVIAIVGEVSSGNTQQIAAAAYEKGVPDVAIGATKTDLTGIGANVFRVCYTDDLQGPVMAKFAYQDLGLKKMAIITDKAAPYSQGLSASFKKAYEGLGGQVVDEETYETGASTFTTQLTNLKGKDPQGVFDSGYYAEVGPLVAAARQAGITKNVPFLGGDGWDSPKILESGGDAILGCYFCNHYNNKEPRPIVQEFLSKYKAKFGSEPGTTMGPLGYDAAKLTLQAIAEVAKANPGKPISSLDIIKAINNTEGFKGVSGDITLKGHDGNPPKQAIVVQVEPMAQGFQVFKKAVQP